MPLHSLKKPEDKTRWSFVDSTTRDSNMRKDLQGRLVVTQCHNHHLAFDMFLGISLIAERTISITSMQLLPLYGRAFLTYSCTTRVWQDRWKTALITRQWSSQCTSCSACLWTKEQTVSSRAAPLCQTTSPSRTFIIQWRTCLACPPCSGKPPTGKLTIYSSTSYELLLMCTVMWSILSLSAKCSAS